MAKIFKNTQGESATTLRGWDKVATYNRNRIPFIPDTVGAGVALSKMGTSIPTPFARMLLFRSAFMQVNKLGLNDNSVYGRLVSECLDFLEFVFNEGANITFKTWNVDAEIAALKNSPHPGHQKLGRSLQKFAMDLGVKDIYLIYHNGILMGGTSPYTLVYTSPNWQRLKNIQPQGLAGNVLFADYSNPNINAVPLHNRHIDFQKYMADFIVAYSANVRLAQSELRAYIYNTCTFNPTSQIGTYYREITGLIPFTMADFMQKYDTLRDGVAVDIYGLGGVNSVMLGVQKSARALESSSALADDYKICPTVQRYEAHTGDVNKMPLVLNEFGVTAATYLGGKPWDPATQLVKNPGQDLNTRILPGPGNVVYPYLTEADFLEDKLLRMPYDIDTKAFRTYGCLSNIMLPLKPAFFDYFNPEDIGKVPNLSLNMVSLPSGGIEVTLRIPIKFSGQGYIDLKKEYMPDEISDVPAMGGGFGLAVFPSYRIVAGKVPNNYAVMIHDQTNSINTRFYEMDAKTVKELDDHVVTYRERTPQASRFAHINSGFTFATVSWNGINCMVVPVFKTVSPSGTASSTTVGIDFGTTNTFVCLSTDNGVKPFTLDIDDTDSQVLCLPKLDMRYGDSGEAFIAGFQGMGSFAQALQREFAPLRLGGNRNNVAFPYRTVVCENDTFATVINDANLYSDVNVGFNFLREDTFGTGFSYKTDLKWSIGGVANAAQRNKRVELFCLQIAWMIKNKILLSNNPVSQFKVCLTFPHTMGLVVKGRLNQFWKNAFDKVMGSQMVTITNTTESIAPYYYQVAMGMAHLENALNIDIGGGTTDMLFADVKNQKLYYNSSMFAGNDIWGDGCHLVGGMITKQNGFVQYFEQLLSSGVLPCSEARKDAYNNYKNMVDNSADLMSYVFRYDDEFHFLENVINNPQLLSLLYVHFAALLYHVTQVLKEKQMTMPTNITFTGMGSKYIQIISSDPTVITELAKMLLSEFSGIRAMPANFKVSFEASPKEVTARGAMMAGHRQLESIAKYEQCKLCVYTAGDGSELTYGKSAEVKQEAMAGYEKFLDGLFDNDRIKNYLWSQFGLKFPAGMKDKLLQEGSGSYDSMISSQDANDPLQETLFFWPFKNALYEASR